MPSSGGARVVRPRMGGQEGRWVASIGLGQFGRASSDDQGAPVRPLYGGIAGGGIDGGSGRGCGRGAVICPEPSRRPSYWMDCPEGSGHLTGAVGGRSCLDRPAVLPGRGG